MTLYKDQFEPHKAGDDLIFKGLGKCNEKRKEHLYPYELDNVWYALMTEVKAERVRFVDKAIVKCMKL